MLPRISEEDLEFCEDLYDPVVLAECLFSDFDNLAKFDESNAELRLGQIPLLSFEYTLDKDPKKSDKENFKVREGAGNAWCLGGRKFGKTLILEVIDTLVSMVCLETEHCLFTSLDALHIRGIVEKIIVALENHPFYKMFDAKINRSPNYRIYLKSGYLLETVNMNLTGKQPGNGFFQKHATRMVVEEGSFETDEVYNKRIDAVSENGCVMRVAGMTNFTKYSPCGRVFYDLTKKPRVMNIPQYINPKWDEREKEHAVREYGGENSVGYRVFVKGEVVEEGISVFDMERVRKNYNENLTLKQFEVTKDSFLAFRNFIVVERPNNVDCLYIAADIGETAPTELVIIGKIADKYRYLYAITAYGLRDKEQFQLFDWLIEKTNANFVGLDTTEGTGRAIFRQLEEKYTRAPLVWVGFNEKVAIDFERDARGNIVIKDGQPLKKEEMVNSWAVKRLKDLYYDEKLEMPVDYKLDIQLNSVIAMQTSMKTIYSCVAPEDHRLSAFKVFGIMEWQTEFANSRPISKKTFCKTSAA